ncbi:nucleobase-ascorbate transporter 2-like [Hibiscus syriacus]|uniref:Nucleobase-ascorbate transporter 2-like n=1 Tax=Hibiscus syriacus TaxID=106335 RepID=A0A6A3C269_HIBSY|nr:nucleobase-ascorbate transporter 2-like [Hibiscus syriacus]
MASRKKEYEGIALLSMYNDEDDEEMGDIEEGDNQQIQQAGEQEEEEEEEQRPLEEENERRESNNMEEDSRTNDNTPPFLHQSSSLSQQQQEPSVSSPQQHRPMVSSKRSRGGRLTIVEYGHDEAVMSPEPEEGGLGSNDDLMIDIEKPNANGDFQGITPPAAVQLTPQSSNLEPLVPEALTNAVTESEAKCSEELQRKIDKFLNLKRVGKSFNAEVRNRKDYRNPDFLLHAVRYQDIDQIGSCFSKDVFDPHGYDKSDYYDEIEADMKHERERKEQESKKNQKVDFVSGGSQPGAVLTAPKVNLPTAAPTAVDNMVRDGRQNKKSKWDKVDSDRRNPLPVGAQHSLSAAGAHTVILSAANAGSGYTAFAQQKRRETEEKKSSEKRLDRRS